MDMSMSMDMESSTTMVMNMGTQTSTTSMDMGMSMSMPSATATSTSSGGMTGMDTTMGMSEMAMVFFTSFDTALFSDAWTPTTQGQYAGTCSFLIALALLLRVLISFKPILETRFWNHNVHYTEQTNIAEEEENRDHKSIPGARLRAAGYDVNRAWSGWRIGAAAGRATYELVLVGVGYLLMIAVMTMNVGYFLSVLAGAWLGTFMLGALANDSRWAGHC